MAKNQYQIAPVLPPTLEMTREQYAQYLANYDLYVAHVSRRKAEVKESLSEKDRKRKEVQAAQKASAKPGPGKTEKMPEGEKPVPKGKGKSLKAKIRRREKRKLKKLEAKLVKDKLEVRILEAAAEKKALEKKVNPRVPLSKDKANEKWYFDNKKMIPKTVGGARNRKSRRAHLQREPTVEERAAAQSSAASQQAVPQAATSPVISPGRDGASIAFCKYCKRRNLASKYGAYCEPCDRIWKTAETWNGKWIDNRKELGLL